MISQETRRTRFGVRVSVREREALEAMAATQCQPLSQVIREAIVLHAQRYLPKEARGDQETIPSPYRCADQL